MANLHRKVEMYKDQIKGLRTPMERFRSTMDRLTKLRADTAVAAAHTAGVQAELDAALKNQAHAEGLMAKAEEEHRQADSDLQAEKAKTAGAIPGHHTMAGTMWEQVIDLGFLEKMLESFKAISLEKFQAATCQCKDVHSCNCGAKGVAKDTNGDVSMEEEPNVP